jgi:hypothetical protein
MRVRGARGAGIPRRRFVQGMAAAGVLAAVPWPLRRAWAGPRAPVRPARRLPTRNHEGLRE